MVHATLGVRAPLQQPAAAGIPTIAWTTQPRAARRRVKPRLIPRLAGFLPDIAAALAFGLTRTTLNRTASDLIRASTRTAAAADRVDCRVRPGNGKESSEGSVH